MERKKSSFVMKQSKRKKLLRNEKNIGGNNPKIKMERKKSSFVMKQSERKKSKEN